MKLQRIAVVNRAEPAVRLIHAVRELNAELGLEVRTIAFYTEPDARSLYVAEADEAVSLGAPTFLDPADGKPKSSYLDHARLRAALIAARADAAWVGWGFVAEQPAFAALCEELGITFIGPSSQVLRQLGDKIAFKQLCDQLGVPVVPWSGGLVADVEAATVHAERLGYPLVVKAAAGGGGRGIRVVRRAEDLRAAFESAQAEGLKFFGSAEVFLERCLPAARHVEVQVAADGQGTTWAVGVRDCSLQRRHQKVVEEAPSPVLDEELERQLREAAVRLCEAAGYRNVGTVEALAEPDARRFYLMELNARLQVEHPVTEVTTGVDLVKLQLHIASGGRLTGAPPPARGHAIEVRLNAEDPERDFAPAPGRIELFRLPFGPGLRVDTGFREGDSIPAEFDSMLAKIIAHGSDRAEALARLRRGLAACTVAIRGGASNKAFLEEILQHPDVVSSAFDIGWLERQANRAAAKPYAEIALIRSAIESYDSGFALERGRFLAAAARGRPAASDEIGHTAELRYGGRTYMLHVRRVDHLVYKITVAGRRLEVTLDRRDRLTSVLTCAGARHRVVCVVQGTTHMVEVNGVPHWVTRDEGGLVRAPAPGIVLTLLVEEGAEVKPGERLLVMEAMKMEMPVAAPFGGIVRRVLVSKNQQVPAGAALIAMQPGGPAASVEAGAAVSFDLVADRSRHEAAAVEDLFRERCLQNLHELRRLMLGYDLDPGEARRLIREHGLLRPDFRPDDQELVRLETELLEIFVDIISLYTQLGTLEDNKLVTAQECMLQYLRSPETAVRLLPAAFVEKLKRALRHYGVSSLERSSELEEALLWIHRSNRRMERQLPVVTEFLERCWEEPGTRAREDGFKELLDRLVEATDDRFRAVNHSSLRVRHLIYDLPHYEEAKARAVRALEVGLDSLTRARPGGPAALPSLASFPQPSQGILASRFVAAPASARRPVLELMARRLCGSARVDSVKMLERGEVLWAAARYVTDRKRSTVALVTVAPVDGLAAALRAVPPLEDLQFDNALLNLTLTQEGDRLDVEATEAEVRRCLDATHLIEKIRRSNVSVIDTTRRAPICHFTHRPADRGWCEERLFRGIAGMVADRLELWRLRGFETERVPAPEDIYLFRAVALENRRDERLFAFVVVRDLTPVFDATGAIVELPQFERLFMQAIAAIREQQTRRERGPLHWNRLVLNLWPPATHGVEQISRIVHKMVPRTDNLGMEKIVIRALIPDETGALVDQAVHFSIDAGNVVRQRVGPPSQHPIRALTPYKQKVAQLRRRGMMDPYELIALLTSIDPHTTTKFDELELDERGLLTSVARPAGGNRANLVVGIIKDVTARHPEGITRVLLAGDPGREMGALAEPECRRILQAFNLAEQLGVPIDWFPLSAGAKIAMDSGTENLDWTAAVLRRITEFTQSGGEVNVVVNGINVGAQSYWNAEATMLMHTRGTLIMTPAAAMVLTGKKALDYSGGVSADDHQGIGGVDQIMGPNGEAQFAARDIAEACRILLRHHDLNYVVPGELFPRRVPCTDPADRDICAEPHRTQGKDDEEGFRLLGEIFADEKNAGRKKPFDIRSIMHAARDRDQPPLERWAMMRNAETAVVWDTRIGGHTVCLIGIESRPIPRVGFIPADGPEQWTAGTLFPLSSKKVARAINAASGRRPVVVLANLSGFDGSPESMRNLQLELGAEIGRGVVNFKGPMIFCVISRYHGGAYVVFSRRLNESLEVAAVEGSFASVIGGAPAAAVVFPAEVRARTHADPRIAALKQELATANDKQKLQLQSRFGELYKIVYAEKQVEVAELFDRVHSVDRAKQVGSIEHLVSPSRLRAYLIEAIGRGVARHLRERQPG